MSYSNYNKAFKQLKAKPSKLKKFKKHNAPKPRTNQTIPPLRKNQAAVPKSQKPTPAVYAQRSIPTITRINPISNSAHLFMLFLDVWCL